MYDWASSFCDDSLCRNDISFHLSQASRGRKVGICLRERADRNLERTGISSHLRGACAACVRGAKGRIGKRISTL